MTDTGRRRLVGGVVFLVALVVFGVSPVAQTTDSFWVTYTAASVVRHGDVDLDEYPEALRRADGFQVDQIDGRQLYEVPVATSLTAAPLVAVALAVDGGSLDAQLERGDPPDLDQFIAALFAALAVAVVYLIATDATGRLLVGAVTSGVLALATGVWSTASRGMWMNTPSMLAVALAVLLAQRLRLGRRPTRTAVLLGLVLAYAVAVRPTNAVLVVALVVWVLVCERTRAVPLVVGGAAGGVALVVTNLVLLGSVLPRYVRGGRLAFSSTVPEALAGNLVSPARGLFVYSPVLLLVVVGVVLRQRRGGLTGLDAAFGAALGLHLVVVSLFPHWWGGWTYGPRFMVDVLPLLVWFLLPVVDLCLDRAVSGPGVATLRASFVVLLAVSVWINARGALHPETFAWNREPVSVDQQPDRLWDWSDPPFLR